MSNKALPGYVATGVWRVKGRSVDIVDLAGTSHSIGKNEISFPSAYYAAV